MEFSTEEYDQLTFFSVLYVESDLEDQLDTTKKLQELCKDITSVQSSQEAMQHFTMQMFDLVIICIDIEEMSGLDLVRELKAINPEQAVIVTSAYTSTSVFLSCLDLGVDAYIQKPCNEHTREQVLKVFKNIIAQRQVEEYQRSLEDLVEAKTKKVLEESRLDKLTGLYNNFALFDYFDRTDGCNILLLNIDHFNSINNGYGYDVGDNVLLEVTRLLSFVVPKSVRIYRLSADEFVLVDEFMNDEELEHLAKSINSFFLESMISIDEFDFKISFSIGIARGRSSSVLNHAKMALGELRDYKRGSYQFYNPSSEYIQNQQINIYWVQKIKELIHEGNLRTFYQPIINNQTKQIEKYECLIRVLDDGELVTPYYFMKAAKQTGVLPYMTQVSIKNACRMFKDSDAEFSINVTNEDLMHEYLEEYLLKHTCQNDIHPSRVVLEILEDVSTIGDAIVLDQLEALRRHGFKIAIDDFGSESSNFSRLLEFKPDYLKIDGSFIKDILEDEDSQTIVEAVVLIAKKSGIKVIAEYVHSKEVQEKIESYGVDYSQGYYFSPPLEEI